MNFINSGNYSLSLLAYMLFEECYWGQVYKDSWENGLFLEPWESKVNSIECSGVEFETFSSLK